MTLAELSKGVIFKKGILFASVTVFALVIQSTLFCIRRLCSSVVWPIKLRLAKMSAKLFARNTRNYCANWNVEDARTPAPR
eukprot:4931139-Amphidinium_carterae.1